MSVRRHEPRTRRAVHIGGFWIFGFLSMALAVLKLTVVAYWSWWRVMLPLLAFLGHNALYILTALISFRWLKDDEEESTPADNYSRRAYNIAALLFFFLFFWTTCCDMSRDKAGADSGRARGDSKWWSCMSCSVCWHTLRSGRGLS